MLIPFHLWMLIGYVAKVTTEAFPQPLFRLIPGCGFLRVSYRDQCYSVLLCGDRDTILVLHSLTPEKIGLPGSEFPRSRSVMTS